MKKRLVDILIEKGYEQKQADTLIRIGKVYVNDEIIILPSIKVAQDVNIRVKQEEKTWVSRGAYKLLKAIEYWKIDFTNKIILDIGSSTGGFTQVALKHNAAKIYALDVGTNQLDYSLRKDSKIVVYEQTNLKKINLAMFDEPLDLIVCDVSFISLKEVFKVLAPILRPKTQLILLIKPQFEASPKYVEKGGVVNEKYHDFLINRLIENAKEFYNYLDHIPSPILGKTAKNIEYLALFERNANEIV